MQPSYKIYDFQQYLNNLRLPFKLKERTDETAKKLLDSITKDMTLEDTSFYKEYLSKFDVEKAIEGYELVTNPESKATKDDYLMLLRLICASFTTADFEALFDNEHKTVEFTIEIGSDERSVTKKLQDFFYLHILMLMERYLGEQINMEAMRMDSEADREAIDLKRSISVICFENKMKKYREQAERQHLNINDENSPIV